LELSASLPILDETIPEYDRVSSPQKFVPPVLAGANPILPEDPQGQAVAHDAADAMRSSHEHAPSA
jgi:hypothetical protein